MLSTVNKLDSKVNWNGNFIYVKTTSSQLHFRVCIIKKYIRVFVKSAPELKRSCIIWYKSLKFLLNEFFLFTKRIVMGRLKRKLCYKIWSSKRGILEETSNRFDVEVGWRREKLKCVLLSKCLKKLVYHVTCPCSS